MKNFKISILLLIFISWGIQCADDIQKSDDHSSKSHYGGVEDDKIFKQESDKVLKQAAKNIEKIGKFSNERKKSISHYFMHYLTSNKGGLASKRREIAMETKSENKEDFGVLRPKDGELFFTAIIPGKYELWREELCSVFFNFNKGDNLSSEWKVRENCRYRFNKFNFDPRKLPFDDPNINKECCNLIMKCAPSDHVLNEEYNGGYIGRYRHNIYQIEMNIKINGFYVPSTKIYFSIKDGVDQFEKSWVKEKSNIMVAHSYPENAELFLIESGKLWEKAIEWNKKDNINDLKELLALYSYIMFHAAPWYRGSASIVEWSVKAIAQYHGFIIDWESSGWKLPLDQKALLTCFIDDFINEFKEKVILSPL